MPLEKSSLFPDNKKHSYSDHKMLYMLVKYTKTDPHYLDAFFSRLSNHEIISGDEIIHLSISKAPEHKHQFLKHTSFTQIKQHYQHHRKWIKMSYQLPSGQWLNYEEGARWTYYYYILLFLTLIFILVLVISSAVMINLYFSSLRKIKRSAKELGVDMYTKIDGLHVSPLMHDTIVILKGMQHRIQDLVTRNAQVLGAISHDLRTPILRIKLKLEYLEDNETALSVIKSLKEMERMITELINFSKDSTYKEPKALVDLNSILLNCCYEYEDTGKNIMFEGLDDPLEFLGAKQSLKRCFTNIINNAFKFGDKVWVSSAIDKNRITITIKDNGPGIPEKELANVMKPFYRTREGKKASSTGAGLGLAIVGQIVHYHGGEITLSNASEGGLEVKTIFPN